MVWAIVHGTHLVPKELLVGEVLKTHVDMVNKYHTICFLHTYTVQVTSYEPVKCWDNNVNN